MRTNAAAYRREVTARQEAADGDAVGRSAVAFGEQHRLRDRSRRLRNTKQSGDKQTHSARGFVLLEGCARRCECLLLLRRQTRCDGLRRRAERAVRVCVCVCVCVCACVRVCGKAYDSAQKQIVESKT